ncbi:MAG TPA: hypothetical protein DEZ09_03700 [Holosporales bacterium]|nr:hypothetical protein [Holosporales bacterium]
MTLLKTMSFIAVTSAFLCTVNAASSAEDATQERFNPTVSRVGDIGDCIDLHPGLDRNQIDLALLNPNGNLKMILRRDPNSIWNGGDEAEFIRNLTGSLRLLPDASLSSITEFRLDPWFLDPESRRAYVGLLATLRCVSPNLKTFVWVRDGQWGQSRFWTDDYIQLTRDVFPNLKMTDFKVLNLKGQLKNNFKWIDGPNGKRGLANNQDFLEFNSELRSEW